MLLQRSSRDAAAVPRLLEEWLARELPEGAAPAVTLHSSIDANGMSSETLVLDAAWTGEDGSPRTAEYVARVAPSQDDFPVFAHYDLADQYDAMRIVAEQTDVPVPRVGLSEPTGSVLGTPFFLMDRVEGVVPPDVLPYTFGGNWLFDAGPADQRRLQDASVEVVAALHAIPDAATTFAFLDPARHGHEQSSTVERNLAAVKEWYEFAIPDIGRSPLVERALAWLESHVPTPSGDPVLCWGDARIGNIMYRDFAPVAVLDWEMATLGPRELDVSWMVFAHQVFESISGMLELPGMPHFLREEDVVARYEDLTGATLGDLDWYHVYNGLEWCVVFMRTGARQIHFGEIERPEDIETLFHCKPLVERYLEKVGAP
jgi:aminoglycoside phosphotransferase (APT) family kinase protein